MGEGSSVGYSSGDAHPRRALMPTTSPRLPAVGEDPDAIVFLPGMGQQARREESLPGIAERRAAGRSSACVGTTETRPFVVGTPQEDVWPASSRPQQRRAAWCAIERGGDGPESPALHVYRMAYVDELTR